MTQKKFYITKLKEIEQLKFIDECQKNKIRISEAVINQPIDRNYPFIHFEIDENGKGMLGLNDGPDDEEGDIKVSSIKFKQLVRNHKDPIEIKLNNEYTAIILSDSIKVGCQLFPFSIIKDLAKAAKIKL